MKKKAKKPVVAAHVCSFGQSKNKTMQIYIANSNCVDCGFDVFPSEYVMFKDPLWKRLSVNGCLCIGCVERRLKRKLNAKDFHTGPDSLATINLFRAGVLSERCITRMGWRFGKNTERFYVGIKDAAAKLGKEAA